MARRVAMCWLALAGTAGVAAAEPRFELATGAAINGDPTLTNGLIVAAAGDVRVGRAWVGFGVDWNSSAINERGYYTSADRTSMDAGPLRRVRLLARGFYGLDTISLGGSAGVFIRSVEYVDETIGVDTQTIREPHSSDDIGLAIAPAMVLEPTASRWLALQLDWTIHLLAGRRAPDAEDSDTEHRWEIGLRVILRPFQ